MKLLEIVILQVLRGYLPNMGTEKILFISVNRDMPQAVTTAEITTALNAMQERREVVGIRWDEDGLLRWKISPNGLARLATLGV
jgi:hypothetical protein